MKKNEVNPLTESPYCLSVAQQKNLVILTENNEKMFALKKNMLARTDGFNFEEIDNTIEMAGRFNKNLQSRMISTSDLTPKLYDFMAKNKNSIANWFEPLNQAIIKQSFFKVPKTKIIRLPIELAQFIRIEYMDTREEDRKRFNEIIFDAFNLKDGQTYFIKTGNFSSKFQFANAKCSEPREMGEYFQVINNFAMLVGAGSTIDLTVREYIEDVENNPTIYNGLPLRTEFRTFVDFDQKEVIGTVPYWDPMVMKNALKNQMIIDVNPQIKQDLLTYESHEKKILKEFNEHVKAVNSEMEKLIKNINLKGQYSIDVMKNGKDFYVIDMALMSESALVELLPTEIQKKYK